MSTEKRQIQIRRGLLADIPALASGEQYFSTDKREFHIGSSVGNIRIHGDYVTPEMYGYGLSGNTVAQNTAAIQAAINAQAAGGAKYVVFSQPLYTVSKTSGQPYCINLPSESSVWINRGTIIKLADGQLTDASGLVHVFYFKDVDDIYIGGGGEIQYNYSGQTGWTGGYLQATGSASIFGQATAPHSNIIIDDIFLNGCVSTVVNIFGTDTTNLFTNVALRHLRVDNVGEGPQVAMCKNVVMEDITVTDTADVMVGDPLEVAGCDGFKIRTIEVHTHCNGQGVDIYGSCNGSLSDFNIHDADCEGPEIGDGGEFSGCKNINVTNGIVRNCSQGFTLWGPTLENINLDNIISTGNLGDGFKFGTSVHYAPISGPISMTNCKGNSNGGHGIAIYAVANLTKFNCQFNSNTYDGFNWIGSTSVTADAQIGNNKSYACEYMSNGQRGIDFLNLSYGYNPEFIFSDYKSSNTMDNIRLQNTAWRSYITFKNRFPDQSIYIGDGDLAIGIERAIANANLTHNLGTKGQFLTMVFTASRTITHHAGMAGQYYLSGSVDFAGVSGNRLFLYWDSAYDAWFELGRKV